MKINELQTMLSKARFDRFLVASGNDVKKALRLYRANLALSEKLHPVVGTLEVILRNKLNTEIIKGLSDPNWAISSRGKLPASMAKELVETEKKMIHIGRAITNDGLISEQTFNFWTRQFEKSNFRILRGSPIYAFRFRPKTVNREDLRQRLHLARMLRNRINHSEPICFSGTQIDFSNTEKTYDHLCELLDWLDPNARKLLKGVDGTRPVLNRCLSTF